MTSSKKQKKPRGRYAIGYGKPPLHTRFAKGQSGNPGGRPARPQGTSLERARALALEEAFVHPGTRAGGRGAGGCLVLRRSFPVSRLESLRPGQPPRARLCTRARSSQ